MDKRTSDSVKQIIDNYNMGFIGAHEVCEQFLDILTYFGADKALSQQMDNELQPLARFLMDNFENHKYNQIENFQQYKKDYV